MEDSGVLVTILLILFVVLPRLTQKKKKSDKSATKPSSPAPSPRPSAGAGVSKTVYSTPRELLSGKQHGEDHTHDRLDLDCAVPNESQAQHYKKQLDSFLAAGLIEKSEYRLLLKRYLNGR